MPHLTIDDFGTYHVPDGKRLVLAIEDAGVDILHRCGGNAKCTTCRVVFVSGEPTRMTQVEHDRLTENGQLGHFRLSCQSLVTHDMHVRPLMRLSSSGLEDAGPRPEEYITPEPVWLGGVADLSVTIAGVRLANPLVLASGILGTHASLMERVARAGAGAVTAKSAGPVPRGGHVNPSCVDFGPGLLNAIGLANPGAAAEVALLAETKAALAPLGVPLIASIFADTVDNFARVAEVIAAARPDLIEVNISCPNVASEFGEPFAASCPSAAAVTAAVRRAVDPPLIVKLAPNVPDIARIAQAVVDAGADAICAINTMPGMVLDNESGQPVLANRTGGISGPALRPIAVHAVYHIAAVVGVPIIGTGGVATAEDVIEFISAGAAAVGVGSVVYRDGPEVFSQLRDDLAFWLHAHGTTLDEVRGRAHRRPVWPELASPAPVPAGHRV